MAGAQPVPTQLPSATCYAVAKITAELQAKEMETSPQPTVVRGFSFDVKQECYVDIF